MAAIDDSDVDVRRRFLGLDAEACELLAAFWPTIEPRLPEILEGFYRHLVAIPT